MSNMSTIWFCRKRDSAIGSLAIRCYAIFISVEKLNGKQGKVSREAFSKVYRPSSDFLVSAVQFELS